MLRQRFPGARRRARGLQLSRRRRPSPADASYPGRGGQRLPRCLTSGPANGTEDFAFATDAFATDGVFARGKGRRKWFRDQWPIYAGDATLRTGSAVDGVLHADDDCKAMVSEAKAKRAAAESSEAAEDAQMTSLDEALQALGFTLPRSDSKAVPKKPAAPQGRAAASGDASERRGAWRRSYGPARTPAQSGSNTTPEERIGLEPLVQGVPGRERAGNRIRASHPGRDSSRDLEDG